MREHGLGGRVITAWKACAALMLSCALVALPGVVQAQSWPAKPIRLVSPFAAGGGPDVIGRLLAPRFSESLGQVVIVENRPGAGGNVGAEFVARAPADGYTQLITTSSIAINVSLYAKLAYSPTRDLAPISLIATAPLLLTTHPSVPAKSVRDLLALAKKAARGGLNYASSGSGTTTHLAGVLLAAQGGVELMHVPYKGSAPAMSAVLGGEVDFGFVGLFTAQALVKAGKLRAVALTSAQPSPAWPGVPTIGSALPGYDMPIWYPLFTTAGTPEAVITRMHQEVMRALKAPDLRMALERDGAEPVGGTPGELAQLLARDIERFGKLVRLAGVKPE
jgi:tripartite-type tricarboxylate transporter receptor subunit TctC